MMKTITNNFKLWIITLVGIIAAACSDPSAHLPETPEVNIYSDLSFLFSREGGQNRVSFETNRPWTAKVLNAPEWVTISKDSGNAGKDEIVITVSEQPDGADYREAVLVINSSAAGKDIHIMQSGKPIVLTSEATGISENTVTLKGSWIYSGDDISVTEYGFALKAGDGAFEKKTVQTRDESTGAFMLTLDDLQAETEYTFHSYAVTSENEEVCGTDLIFKTPAMPTIMTIAEFKTYTREHVSKGNTSVLNENYIIEGTVLSSYIPSENRPSKAVFPLAEPYIQIIDANTANSGLTLYFKAAEDNTFKSGDSVKIRMKDADLKHTSNGAVSAYPLVNQIEITGTGDIPEAVTINHTEIADYEAMPVKIEDTQLIKAHTTDNSVLWKDSDIWTLEVQNSDITYQMFVSSESPLSSQQKMTGSGYLSGIVLTNGTEIAVNADAISLEGERFISMLEPRFTALNFSADNLTIGIENELELSLKYENGGHCKTESADGNRFADIEMEIFAEDLRDNIDAAGGCTGREEDGLCKSEDENIAQRVDQRIAGQ